MFCCPGKYLADGLNCIPSPQQHKRWHSFMILEMPSGFYKWAFVCWVMVRWGRQEQIQVSAWEHHKRHGFSWHAAHACHVYKWLKVVLSNFANILIILVLYVAVPEMQSLATLAHIVIRPTLCDLSWFTSVKCGCPSTYLATALAVLPTTPAVCKHASEIRQTCETAHREQCLLAPYLNSNTRA